MTRVVPDTTPQTLKLNLRAQLEVSSSRDAVESVIITVSVDQGVNEHVVPASFPSVRRARLIADLSRADQALITGIISSGGTNEDEGREIVWLLVKEWMLGSAHTLGAVVSRDPRSKPRLLGWLDQDEIDQVLASEVE